MRTQIIHDLNRGYYYRVCLNFCLEYRYYKYYDGEKDIKKWGRFLPCLRGMLNHLQKSITSNNIKQISSTRIRDEAEIHRIHVALSTISKRSTDALY